MFLVSALVVIFFYICSPSNQETDDLCWSNSTVGEVFRAGERTGTDVQVNELGTSFFLFESSLILVVGSSPDHARNQKRRAPYARQVLHPHR
jgi:hypothetical protein